MRCSVEPGTTGLSLPAVGAEGIALTVTLVSPAAEVQPFTVAVTLYVPVAAVVALVIVGSCALELNPLGPVHAYVAPLTVVAVRCNVEPSQIGLSLPAVGAEGMALTVAAVVPAEDVQPLTVAVTLYVPVAAVVALVIDGFWDEELKLLGPDHEYVAPDTVVAVKFNVEPTQTGPLFPAVGAGGMAFTVAWVAALAADQQPFTIT